MKRKDRSTTFKIDEETIEKTSRCEKDFLCLQDGKHELCKVTHSIRDSVLFVECLEKRPCSYKMSWGYSSFICNCPTRKEIFKRHKK